MPEARTTEGAMTLEEARRLLKVAADDGEGLNYDDPSIDNLIEAAREVTDEQVEAAVREMGRWPAAASFKELARAALEAAREVQK